MPRRTYPFLAGGTGHLYNRGHNRQAVFRNDADYRAFLLGLRAYLGTAPAKPGASVGARLLAYCLRPNHYHLVPQPEDDRLSSRMRRLLISFTKSLNAKYGRLGALFKKQFQTVAVQTDEQLIPLTACLYHNPVEAGLVLRPEEWEYSSCRENLGLRAGRLPQPALVRGRCAGRRDHRRKRFVAGDTHRGRIVHLALED